MQMTMTKEKRRGRTRIEEIELKSVDGLEEIICFVKRRSRAKRFVIFDSTARKNDSESARYHEGLDSSCKSSVCCIHTGSFNVGEKAEQPINLSHNFTFKCQHFSLSSAHIFPFYVVDA